MSSSQPEKINFISRLIPVTGKYELVKLVCSQHMGLHSSIGRTLQRSRRFHEFESCWSFEEFFRAKICNCLNCDYNRNDHISISFVFPHFQSTSFHILKYVRLASVFPKLCVWMSVALRFVVLRCVALRYVTFRCVPVRSVHSYGTDREILEHEIFHNIKEKHRSNSYSSGGF